MDRYRDIEAAEDLGLIDNDRTEDLRKTPDTVSLATSGVEGLNSHMKKEQ